MAIVLDSVDRKTAVPEDAALYWNDLLSYQPLLLASEFLDGGHQVSLIYVLFLCTWLMPCREILNVFVEKIKH